MQTQYNFEEFEKIWSPRGSFLRSSRENFFLVLMKGPEDPYARIYRVSALHKNLELEYDAGAPISSLFTDPKHEHFYFAKDTGGDENTQIYEYFPKDKSIQKVFGYSGFQASVEDMSEDGQRLYISSNHENKAVYSLYLLNRNTQKIKRLTTGLSVSSLNVNPDESAALLSLSKNNSENELYYLDLKTLKRHKLKLAPKTEYEISGFHPKDKNLALVNTNLNYDRNYCATLNLKTLQINSLKQSPDKDFYCSYSFMEDLAHLTEGYNASYKSRIFEGFFEKEIKLPHSIQNMTLSSKSLYPFQGRKLSFVARSSNNPGSVFEFSIQNKELEKIMDLNASRIKAEDFAKSYDFTFESFDKLPIHSVYFAKKEWLKSKKKYPVILWPHGGPDYLTEHDYSVRFQYWVNRGYIVLGPNFRGSTGYGKKFETLNDKDWGGGHIKDLLWAKKEFSKLSFVDPNNFFIVGASFGGYSVLSTITQYPKEFKAAEATVAIGNLFTFIKSIPPDPAWQGEFLTEMGDPIKDKKLYKERSPFYSADKISIPLKINQAENDVRTVLGEMNDFVAKLKEHKIPVDYTVYKNEGHSFQNKDNIRKLIEGTVDFLDKYR